MESNEETKKPLSVFDGGKSFTLSGVLEIGDEKDLGKLVTISGDLLIPPNSEVKLYCDLKVGGEVFISSKLTVVGSLECDRLKLDKYSNLFLRGTMTCREAKVSGKIITKDGLMTIDDLRVADIGSIYTSGAINAKLLKSSGPINASYVTMGRAVLLPGSSLDILRGLTVNRMDTEYSVIRLFGNFVITESCDLNDKTIVSVLGDLTCASGLGIGVGTELRVTGNLKAKEVGMTCRGSMEVASANIEGKLGMGRASTLSVLYRLFVAGSLDVDDMCIVKVGSDKKGKGKENEVEKEKESHGLPSLIGWITSGASSLCFNNGLSVSNNLTTAGKLDVFGDLNVFASLSGEKKSSIHVRGDLKAPRVVLEESSNVSIEGMVDCQNISDEIISKLYSTLDIQMRPPKQYRSPPALSLNKATLTADGVYTSGTVRFDNGSVLSCNSLTCNDSLERPKLDRFAVRKMDSLGISGKPMTTPKSEVVVKGLLKVDWSNHPKSECLFLEDTLFTIGDIMAIGLDETQNRELDKHKNNGILTIVGY